MSGTDETPSAMNGYEESIVKQGAEWAYKRGLKARGCCRPTFPLTEEGIQAYIAHMKGSPGLASRSSGTCRAIGQS